MKSPATKPRKPALADPPDPSEIGARAESRRAYDFKVQVGHLLRRAYQHHMAIFQQLNFDPQLTSVQLAALCALRDQGPSSLTVLGRATGTDPATTRGVVERLKERELLLLSSDASDQRKVIVQLSPEGRALVERMIPVALKINKITTKSLNPAERVALVYLLQKLTGGEADEPSETL